MEGGATATAGRWGWRVAGVDLDFKRIGFENHCRVSRQASNLHSGLLGGFFGFAGDILNQLN